MMFVFPHQPFRVNLLTVFAITVIALILLHFNDRRAGGE